MKARKWIKRCTGAALAGAAVWGVLGSGAAAAPPAGRQKDVARVVIQPNRPAATVNGEVILFGQLEPVFKVAGLPPAGLPEAQRRELQREALALLIDDLLLKQFLRRQVPPASPAEVNKRLAELEAGLRQRKQTLADFCREHHQSEAEVRANIATVLQWAEYARRRVNDADLQRYYHEYRDFFDRVTVRASHIVLRVPPRASEGERTAARARLAELRGRIITGKLDFAAAAKSYSQCPSAANGGDIGTFPRKDVVEENFARAAFALRPGEISDVVQTDIGLHLIKVTERKPGSKADFNKIKEEVREFYMEDLRQDLLARLRKEARIEIHLP